MKPLSDEEIRRRQIDAQLRMQERDKKDREKITFKRTKKKKKEKRRILKRRIPSRPVISRIVKRDLVTGDYLFYWRGKWRLWNKPIK